MRIVVDTNIVFSPILNTNSKIARVFLQPKNKLNFYSTEQLSYEIEEHKGKIKKISNYSDYQFVLFNSPYTLRYSDGVIPVSFLNSELNDDLELKPESNAMHSNVSVE
jgi:hypothetical protein